MISYTPPDTFFAGSPVKRRRDERKNQKDLISVKWILSTAPISGPQAEESKG
jgi:hypothetical protein